MSVRKPILCLDFDGVMNRYSKGWNDGIIDDPTPGFFEWAEIAKRYFQLIVYSSRSKEDAGRLMIHTWLVEEIFRWAENQTTFPEGSTLSAGDFEFYSIKPQAFLTIDDRAIQFRGDWSAWWLDPEKLLEFKPWTQCQPPCPEAATSSEPNPWRPVDDATPKNVWLEVCGVSGMSTIPHFLAIAKHNAQYRPLEPWRDVHGDALRDQGWVPSFWRYSSTMPKVR